MSFTPATPITSSQQGVHHNLAATVVKHLEHESQRPIAPHNQAAFTQAYDTWNRKGRPPVILDSACGTGESSRSLASTYPDHFVIGIDQSEKRLSHSQNQYCPDNCLLLRAECTDFWRLANQAQWRFALHTLFYPNPYPKPRHLQRRWHGEAAFRQLLAISDNIELRTNWAIYAQEFYEALLIANIHLPSSNNTRINEYVPTDCITAFERKYQLSGHTLWQVRWQVNSQVK